MTVSRAGPPAHPGEAFALQGQAPTQPTSPASDAVQGLINFDVVVTDNSGKAIPGLGPKDFTLLDNHQPQKILSFRSFDGVSAKPDPPVEVILVVDTIKMPFDLAAFEREEVERFLRRNGGHLAQPVSIFGLSETGFWTLAQPSGDGNALAAEIASDRLVFIRRRQLLGNGTGEFVDSGREDPAGLKALKTLGDIATAERRKPGRKLLIWVGPGWGIGSGADFESLPDYDSVQRRERARARQVTFNTIYWFSTLLREARISLYSFSVGQTDPDPRSLLYLNFLEGVESVQQASLKNLDRRVLAVQSGGRVLGPDNDLVSKIDNCIREARTFYTLSFDRSHADHPAEYHSLQLQVGVTGLTARTNTGYYDQPYYSDQPRLASRRVTVAELEQVLASARGESDAEVAQRLSDVELTERLSAAKLSSWTATLSGKRARQALVALADASVFLEPSPAEVPADVPPDAGAQRSIISLAVDYLKNTIPKLPNFYATRTTVRYEEIPQYFDASTPVNYQPLHVAASSRATVLYSNGKEVVDSSGAKGKKRKAANGYLRTYGVFGPILGAVTDAIATGLTWNRWERGTDGPHAVFVYQIPAEKSRYQVGGCCLPGGDGTTPFEETVGYHGEIAIDPPSGAILRMELVADLKSTTPLVRSDIMIEYGPVQIGGKTYMCPVRSVSISRGRSVTTLTEWDESFRTYGPYATMLNDFAFEHYHVFRAKSHVLTSFNPSQEEQSVPPKSH
ncbi:MAG: VWA domain-containing protein [Candidatus Sulfotelmatobacter sp.]